MDWTLFDFLVAGGLIGAVVLTAALVFRSSRNSFYRAGLITAVLTSVALVWVTGAVGLIGSEANLANLILLGLVPLWGLGGLITKFSAAGLSRTLSIVAIVQFMIGGIALLAGWGETSRSWPWDIVIGNAVFSAAWLISAWFFSKAATSPAGMRASHNS